jgi:hypothetical protein
MGGGSIWGRKKNRKIDDRKILEPAALHNLPVRNLPVKKSQTDKVRPRKTRNKRKRIDEKMGRKITGRKMVARGHDCLDSELYIFRDSHFRVFRVFRGLSIFDLRPKAASQAGAR